MIRGDRRQRHLKILELIETHAIHTQEELADALAREGWDVTQSSVSRDIAALKLVKADGIYHRPVVTKGPRPDQDEQRIVEVLAFTPGRGMSSSWYTRRPVRPTGSAPHSTGFAWPGHARQHLGRRYYLHRGPQQGGPAAHPQAAASPHWRARARSRRGSSVPVPPRILCSARRSGIFRPGQRYLGGSPGSMSPFGWPALDVGPAAEPGSGADALGREVLDLLARARLDTTLIQIDPRHPTGTVTVDTTDPGGGR
ncbi:MAG: hypothetical protein R2882_07880 [Gemmatimonadales bacterium]